MKWNQKNDMCIILRYYDYLLDMAAWRLICLSTTLVQEEISQKLIYHEIWSTHLCPSKDEL